MVILDKLLSQLKKESRKVLVSHSDASNQKGLIYLQVFSQMTRMLDIVQDYLHFRKYKYERLDGSVRGEVSLPAHILIWYIRSQERYLAVQNFTKDEEEFVFLLSTRAGGLGLNLTSAGLIFHAFIWEA